MGLNIFMKIRFYSVDSVVDENPYLLLHSVVDTEMINCNIKDGTKYILFSAFQYCKKLEK